MHRIVSRSTAKSIGTRPFSTAVDPARRPVIVSAVRTPIGSIQGAFSTIDGPNLGAIAVRAAVERAGITGSDVGELIMGNVVSAGMGQAPARQASMNAGLSPSVVCTTVNKMCASGLKATMLASQSIMLGDQRCMVAGGFESMTFAPYYVPKARSGYRFGHGTLEDGLLKDGLTDAYNGKPMGWCAEECAKKYNITRKDQDDFAIRSYVRAREASEQGRFKDEIVPVSIPSKKGSPTVVSVDEEFKNIVFEKIPTLKGAFVDKDGTVTAANSSKLSDGAAAMVIMSAEKAEKAGLKPIARILGYGDAEQLPVDFPTSPALAIPRALKHAGLNKEDVAYWEINEAFAVVSLANQKLLNLDPERLNVNGGAVALGHPIGCSGARIIVSLISILKQHNSNIGVAAICNGGGGASAIVIEKL